MNSVLAPGLLVAAPNMSDPRFRETVILLAEAGEDGALGFVVNRDTDFTFRDLANDIQFDVAPEILPRHLMYGGPVSPERGWILFRETHSPAIYARDNILHVTTDIHLAATLEVLGEFVTRENDAPFKLMLGYAGWGPEQLEEEIRDGAWLPLELEPELLFDVPNDEMWTAALASLGLSPGSFVMGRGGGSA